MAHWLGTQLFGKPLPVVTHTADIPADALVLNYSTQPLAHQHYQVCPHGLLFEDSIHPVAIDAVNSHDMLMYFLQQQGDHPFDLLSAAFYQLSRYEEYLPFEKDEYGRYSHTNSLAWKQGFLKRPFVDEWLEDLKKRLQARWGSINFHAHTFHFTPTYDVDVAWSFRNKGLWRNLGGSINDVLGRRWKNLWQRWTVLLGWQRDPFEIFHDLREFHRYHHLRPIYFFLLAAEYKGYDRNISITRTNLQQLMRWINDEYSTGIHLSWAASQDESLILSEIHFMEKVLKADVTANRMHYLNFHLPTTYRQLIAAGIKQDYSMGYGTINGFRAGTSRAFYWYDLAEEKSTPLLLHPFAWMEANNIFEQKDSPAEAINEWYAMHDAVEKVGGHLISVCHNHLIGMDKQGRQWWEAYWKYIREKVDKDRHNSD